MAQANAAERPSECPVRVQYRPPPRTRPQWYRQAAGRREHGRQYWKATARRRSWAVGSMAGKVGSKCRAKSHDQEETPSATHLGESAVGQFSRRHRPGGKGPRRLVVGCWCCTRRSATRPSIQFAKDGRLTSSAQRTQLAGADSTALSPRDSTSSARLRSGSPGMEFGRKIAQSPPDGSIAPWLAPPRAV